MGYEVREREQRSSMDCCMHAKSYRCSCSFDVFICRGVNELNDNVQMEVKRR